MTRPTEFIIVSIQRAGSHFLRSLLRSHPQALVFGEVFNTDERARSRHLATLDLIRPFRRGEAIADYLGNVLLSAARQGVRAVGFKTIIGPLANREIVESIASCVRAKELSVVHCVRRNMLDCLLSYKLAKGSGAFIELDADEARLNGVDCKGYAEPVAITASELDQFVREAESYDSLIRRTFSGNPYLCVSYENLSSGHAETLAGLLDFLGLPPHHLQARTKRQRKGSQREWISNFDELARSLQGTSAAAFLDP